jgi:acetyl-CoA carboxylase biotin carboxyl carrier protein
VVAEADGTMYLRPDPHSPAFCEVGHVIAEKQTLALIEVMKTFTPVRSPAAGRVERVHVTDAAAVCSGQTLFWIRV